jgi:hypothetical protein
MINHYACILKIASLYVSLGAWSMHVHTHHAMMHVHRSHIHIKLINVDHACLAWSRGKCHVHSYFGRQATPLGFFSTTTGSFLAATARAVERLWGLLYKGSFFLSFHATHRQDRWLYYALALACSGWFSCSECTQYIYINHLVWNKTIDVYQKCTNIQNIQKGCVHIGSSPCGLWMHDDLASKGVRLRPAGNFQIRMSRNLYMCAPKRKVVVVGQATATHGHVRTHCFTFVASFVGAGWYFNTSKHDQLRKRILS